MSRDGTALPLDYDWRRDGHTNLDASARSDERRRTLPSGESVGGAGAGRSVSAGDHDAAGDVAGGSGGLEHRDDGLTRRDGTALPLNGRVVHNKREPFDVYIGRPSKWGNPFSHKDGTLAEFRVATRDDAVDAYAEWIKTQPELLAALPDLRGKVLGCWCSPQRCHGDVLVEMANA